MPSCTCWTPATSPSRRTSTRSPGTSGASWASAWRDDEESARKKVKAAQDGWNSRDPEKVALAYTEDSVWRNRDEFFQGREAIKEFLRRKWDREQDYRLEKNLWCFTQNRIAVRFEYESRDAEGQWWRSHGNELWEFDAEGYMRRRDASINDYKIEESERKFRFARPGEEEVEPAG